MNEAMRDAALARNIDTTFTGIIGGYLTPGDPFHPWSRLDWGLFPHNKKLPIFARSNPGTAAGGRRDAFAVLEQLYDLQVPRGAPTAIDLETAEDAAYVTAYGRVLHYFGYKVLPYGSKDSLFKNPALDGYWVADWVLGNNDPPPHMLRVAGKVIRATQYAHDVAPGFDRSTVKWWVRNRWTWWI